MPPRPAASPPPERKRRPTATSNFGVSRRENHDSSAFYARFEVPVASEDEEIRSPLSVDEVFCGDARNMADVADKSVALVVTSPPYFAGKEYEQALGEGHIPASYFDYLEMLHDVFAECVRALEPGGRIAVNIANLGRKPYRSLSADITTILQDRLGLWLRGEVLWRKGAGASNSCAWGSFRQPSNPVLRDTTERVIIASKGRLDRAVPRADREAAGLPSTPTITKDEFLAASLDVWDLPTESARRVSHPAPFPVDLPVRLIELYTYAGDLVLDPFMGSGTTAVAATRTDRRFVGYDTDPEYVEISLKRVAEEQGRLLADEPTDNPDGEGLDKISGAAIAAAGFSDVRTKVKRRGGLEFAFGATDAKGRPWLFDVVGGFTTSANGLRRTDLLYRTLGRASVVRLHDPATRVLVLTSSLPKHNSAGDQALNAARGETIVDALVPTDGDARAAMKRLATGRASKAK
jgi:site-specific DNA-methyltransferase (adenine-specific)